ncbi:MAG: UDP-2,3-diacylglucosamine diphosphatase, partial [Burkholderiales bacterium]|nr:UDP-2,3-diacylglucosamine diphosphatase [Burkholderiales bacterium]
RLAMDRGVDGVVCGHIHHAEIREIHSILYCNDGDWVESCTTLLEHLDGSLELVYWADRFEQSKNIESMIAAKKAA